jgi:hypothetical protein
MIIKQFNFTLYIPFFKVRSIISSKNTTTETKRLKKRTWFGFGQSGRMWSTPWLDKPNLTYCKLNPTKLWTIGRISSSAS